MSVPGTNPGLNPQQREAQLKKQQMDEIRRKKAKKIAAGKIGKISKDADFEKMFGKDIDEFLEDSEWDIESIDKMSQFSKGSKNTYRSGSQQSKLRGLEKVYLQKIEGQSNAMSKTGQQPTGSKPKAGKFRGATEERPKKAWDTQSKGSNMSKSRPGKK